MKIFGRPVSGELSALSESADKLHQAGASHDRAAATNFIHDSRVSSERAVRFWEWCHRTGNASSLILAAEEYRREVQRRPEETFLHADNGANLAKQAAQWSGGWGRSDPLATVVDLTGLAEVLRRGRLAGIVELQGLPAAASLTDAEINAFYEPRLEKSDEDVRDRTVGAILEAIARSEPRHPVWTVPWDHFLGRINQDPASWLEAVGVHRATYPRWIIVMRYRLEEAGTLVRPTQLEAGWSGFHFPSPPAAEVQRGGHPMSLQERTKHRRHALVSEFIHPQVRFRVEHWRAAGRMSGATTRIAGSGELLASYRQGHWQDLVTEYGVKALGEWMQDGNN